MSASVCEWVQVCLCKLLWIIKYVLATAQTNACIFTLFTFVYVFVYGHKLIQMQNILLLKYRHMDEYKMLLFVWLDWFMWWYIKCDNISAKHFWIWPICMSVCTYGSVCVCASVCVCVCLTVCYHNFYIHATIYYWYWIILKHWLQIQQTIG